MIRPIGGPEQYIYDCSMRIALSASTKERFGIVPNACPLRPPILVDEVPSLRYMKFVSNTLVATVALAAVIGYELASTQ